MTSGKTCRCGCDSKGVRKGFFLKKCYLRLKATGVTKVTFRGKEVPVEYVEPRRPESHKSKGERDGSRGGATLREQHEIFIARRSAARADALEQALALRPRCPTLPVYDAILPLAAFLLRKLDQLIKDIPSGRGLVLNVFYAGAGTLHSVPEALSSLMRKSATLVPSASSTSGGAALFSKQDLLEDLCWQYEAHFGGDGPVSRGAENVVHDYLFERYKSLGYSHALERVMFTMRKPGLGSYYEGVKDSFAGIGWSYDMLEFDEITGVTTLSPGVMQGRTGGTQPGPVHAQDVSRGDAPGTLVGKALALAHNGSAVLPPPERTTGSLDVAPARGTLIAMTLIALHGHGGRNAFYTVLGDDEEDGYLRYSVITGGIEAAGAPFAIPKTHMPNRSSSSRSLLIHLLQTAYDKAWARGTGGSDNAASRKYRLVYVQHAGATYIDEASPEGQRFIGALRDKSAALRPLQQVNLSPAVHDAWAQVTGSSKDGCGLPDIFAGISARV